jgi:hypothetical protein
VCLLQHASPRLHPAQTLLAASASTAAGLQHGALSAVPHQPFRLAPGPLTFMAHAVHSMGPLSAFNPTTAFTPADIASSDVPAPQLLPFLRCLGWPHPCSSAAVPQPPLRPAVATIPVRFATAALLKPAAQQRQRLQAAYVAHALNPAAPLRVVNATACTSLAARLRSTLAAVWRLPWDNKHKDTLWRLQVDGIRAAKVPGPCPCGAPIARQPFAKRQHQFWECPVAMAVRAQLPAGPQSAVWLLEAPEGIHVQVWHVVCLAALSAMAWGRGALWGRKGGQPFLPAGEVAAVCDEVVELFWTMLQDFVQGLPGMPSSWLPVPEGHPFLAMQGGRLVCHRPDVGGHVVCHDMRL